MDFSVHGGGTDTVYRVTINTEPAANWITANVELESWQYLGKWGFAVEHRYIDDLVAGMLEAGLSVWNDVKITQMLDDMPT
jgi:hypothetical protein